ncbi:MAG: exported protein of unknown function [Nitrospira sp.]|jgi:hypothetical protein|nr:exported protein of unknown function [Nitrospira sp.]
MTFRTGKGSTFMAFAGLLMICGTAAAASGSAHEQSSDQQGHPKAIFGTIDRIHGEEYSIKGDRGQDVSLRVTKDTNVVCASGKGAHMSTSRDAVKDTDNVAKQQGSQGKAADLEKGSEFVAQSKESCTFKAGDFVKIVGSDMGTAEMIQKLARDKAESQ